MEVCGVGEVVLFVGIADLLLGCFRVDLEGFVYGVE